MDRAPLAAVALLILIWLWKRLFGSTRLRLPPGPRPWPIIGSALDMPTVRPWETYQKWHERFSEYASIQGARLINCLNVARLRARVRTGPYAGYPPPWFAESSDGSVGQAIAEIL